MSDRPVITVRRRFARPATALIEAFRGAPTGNVSDACGRRGALPQALKPVTRAAAFCGPVLTVEAGRHDNLAPWMAIDHLQAGDVLLIATGGYPHAAVVGDIVCGFAASRGAAAVVTDGMVRDLAGLDELGIPVVAAGVQADGPNKLGPGSIGLPVWIDGRRIESGDIAVGDRDGVVIVPGAQAEAAATAVQEVIAKEATIEAERAAGAPRPGWLDQAIAKVTVVEAD